MLIGYANAAESPFELEIVTKTTTTFYGDVPGENGVGSYNTDILIFRALEDGVELWGMKINRGRCSGGWGESISDNPRRVAEVRVGKKDENFVEVSERVKGENKDPIYNAIYEYEWKVVQKIPLKEARAKLGKAFELNFSETREFVLDFGCDKIIEVKVQTNMGDWVSRFR